MVWPSSAILRTRLAVSRSAINRSTTSLLTSRGADLTLARPSSKPRQTIAHSPVLCLAQQRRPAFAELDARCLKHRQQTRGCDRRGQVAPQVGPALPGDFRLDWHHQIEDRADGRKIQCDVGADCYQ